MKGSHAGCRLCRFLAARLASSVSTPSDGLPQMTLEGSSGRAAPAVVLDAGGKVAPFPGPAGRANCRNLQRGRSDGRHQLSQLLLDLAL